MDNILSIKDIKKIYKTSDEDITAIENISLDIAPGEIVGIVGTSGCGKSTLLNIVAGLDKETSGSITFDKENPKVSYMLQSDALLPWRTVLDNATLGLELMHMLDEQSKNFCLELLSEYGLEDFVEEKPSSLSGGMRQRVALIRSLAINPDIILLDEPFSALDYYTRLTISEDVHRMLKELNTTAIIITHDIQEALGLSDRVVVLSNRPSTIKSIYDVPFKDELSIQKRRLDPRFNEIYEKIWGDLDVKI